MYTSTYSSSPVRTSTAETGATNYQSQSYHRQYYQPSNNINNNDFNSMNDNNMASRRAGGYSNSTSSLTGIPPRNYPNYYYNSPLNDTNRYQSATIYSSSPRLHGNDHETFRSNNNPGGNARTYSYDDITNEQSRPPSATYSPRNNNNYQYRQQQPQTRRNQYDGYDNDDDDLIVKSTDLSAAKEQEMVELVRIAFRRHQISNQRELAGFLKQSADKRFASCWHCIVGKQFSSYVTHEMNGFIYITKGPLSILLFKSGA